MNAQEILLPEQIKQEVKEEPLENSLPNSPESAGETPTDPLQIENSEIIPKVEELKEEPKEESKIVEESKPNESASSVSIFFVLPFLPLRHFPFPTFRWILETMLAQTHRQTDN